MKILFYKPKLLVLTLAAVIAACGGGGDESASTPAPLSATTSIDYAQKYVGNWRTGCYTSAATDITTSAAAMAIKDYTLSKVSDTQVRAQTTEKLYASTDIACAGPVLGTIIMTGSNTGAYGGYPTTLSVLPLDVWTKT